MTHLHIALLGPIHIALDDQPVTQITSPKILGLLAYLAAEGTRAHSRESLAELLWSGQATGRQNLRKSLSRLQRALPQPQSDPPFFHATRQEIGFNPACAHTLDLTAFRDGLSAIRSHPHTDLHTCRACRQRLDRAVALYRGEFLDGLLTESEPFDAWALARREWLRQEALWALGALAEIHLHTGENDPAGSLAQRQLAIDPLHEAAHHQLLRALAAQGRPRDALTHYEQMRAQLRRELDVAPAEATRALYDAIRQGDAAPAPRAVAPSPPSSSPPPHNLPPQFTPFIGREDELTAVAQRLDQPACRLLTLTGPGGVGKSRLALEVAQQRLRRYRDGVWWVPLAPLRRETQVADASADSLRFFFPAGAQTSEARQEALSTFLARRQALLILDNWEHLLPISGWLAELLQQAPDVQILATSRQPLGLRAEWVQAIAGLPVGQGNAPGPAETLFADSLRRTGGDAPPDDWAQIRHICQTVAGFPLALELAAAQSRGQTLAEIGASVQASLDALAVSYPDLPPRHRSLRAVFDSSWALLTPAQQRGLAALSVFRGGIGPAAAEAVAGEATAEPSDLLTQLTARSLLRSAGDGRYAIHQVLRAFAGEQLAPAQRAQALARHAGYFCRLLAAAAPRLTGPEMLETLEALRPRQEDLRQAWDWAADAGARDLLAQALPGLLRFYLLSSRLAEAEEALQAGLTAAEPDAVLSARLLTGLATVCNQTGRYDEALARVDRALSLLAEEDPPPALAQAHLQRGFALSSQTRHEEARQALDAALALARAHELPEVEVDCLRTLGVMHQLESEYETARQVHEQELLLCRQLGDRQREANALSNLGVLHEHLGEFEAGVTYLKRASAHFHELGNRRGEAAAAYNLSTILAEWGHLRESGDYRRRALDIFREIGEEYGVALALNSLASDLWMDGQFQASEQANREARALFRKMGDQHDEILTLIGLGFVAGRLGEFDQAHRLLDEAVALARSTKSVRLEASALLQRSLVLLLQRRLADGVEEALAMLELAQESQFRTGLLQGHWLLGQMHLARGDVAQAQAAFRAGLAHVQESDAPLTSLELSTGLAEALRRQGQPAEAAATVRPLLPLLLESDELLSVNDAMQVYLDTWRVLRAVADPAAAEVLAEARRRLQSWADGLSDPARRRSLLENVPSHRAVWGKEGTRA